MSLKIDERKCQNFHDVLFRQASNVDQYRFMIHLINEIGKYQTDSSNFLTYIYKLLRNLVGTKEMVYQKNNRARTTMSQKEINRFTFDRMRKNFDTEFLENTYHLLLKTLIFATNDLLILDQLSNYMRVNCKLNFRKEIKRKKTKLRPTTTVETTIKENEKKRLRKNLNEPFSHHIWMNGEKRKENEDIHHDKSKLNDDFGNLIQPTSLVNLQNNQIIDKHRKDPMSELPINVSKRIISLLDRNSLQQAEKVSSNWKNLVQEVKKEQRIKSKFNANTKNMMKLAVTGCDPDYRAFIRIPIPDYRSNEGSVEVETEKMSEDILDKDFTPSIVERHPIYRRVIVEERNIVADSYNVTSIHSIIGDDKNINPTKLSKTFSSVHIIENDEPKYIVTAIGQLNDPKSRECVIFHRVSNKMAFKRMHKLIGHSGSVRCIHISEIDNVVYTGSYDCSIRCWSLFNGKCLLVYQGHTSQVVDIDLYGNCLASASYDKTCRIWRRNDSSRTSILSFFHKFPVTKCLLRKEFCYTGDMNGVLRIWNLAKGEINKVIDAHRSQLTCIKIDNYHIATGGVDGFAKVWTNELKSSFTDTLNSFKHPTKVLSLAFKHLRLVTGCDDGKIRLWDVLSGNCLRMWRGTSTSESILSLNLTGAHCDELLVGLRTSIVLFSFNVNNKDNLTSNVIDELDEKYNNKISLITQEPNKRARNNERLNKSGKKMKTNRIDENNIISRNKNSPLGMTHDEERKTMKDKSTMVVRMENMKNHRRLSWAGNGSVKYIELKKIFNDESFSRRFSSLLDIEQALLSDQLLLKSNNLDECFQHASTNIRLQDEPNVSLKPSPQHDTASGIMPKNRLVTEHYEERDRLQKQMDLESKENFDNKLIIMQESNKRIVEKKLNKSRCEQANYEDLLLTDHQQPFLILNNNNLKKGDDKETNKRKLTKLLETLNNDNYKDNILIYPHSAIDDRKWTELNNERAQSVPLEMFEELQRNHKTYPDRTMSQSFSSKKLEIEKKNEHPTTRTSIRQWKNYRLLPNDKLITLNKSFDQLPPKTKRNYSTGYKQPKVEKSVQKSKLKWKNGKFPLLDNKATYSHSNPWKFTNLNLNISTTIPTIEFKSKNGNQFNKSISYIDKISHFERKTLNNIEMNQSLINKIQSDSPIFPESEHIFQNTKKVL
ncbi:hypothetical protein SNEBB_006726 [Seison nebaliae]|nr:hypothetical protein SNEBB_006726 [Seison nebaliae]